jgi:hypothetical protein
MSGAAIPTRRGSSPSSPSRGKETRRRPVVTTCALAFGQLLLSSPAARADTDGDEVPPAYNAMGVAAFLLASCWLAFCCRRAIRTGRRRRPLRFSTPRSAAGRSRERRRDA